MRHDFKAHEDTQRYNTTHRTRKVWLHETRIKNRRLAKRRTSDYHGNSQSNQPVRREVPRSRVSTCEVASLIVSGIGFISVFVGLSIQNPDESISTLGAVVSLIGMALVYISARLEEKRR